MARRNQGGKVPTTLEGTGSPAPSAPPLFDHLFPVTPYEISFTILALCNHRRSRVAKNYN